MKDVNEAITVLEKWPEKIQALNGIRAYGLCVTRCNALQQQQLCYLYSAKYIGIWSNALYITMLIMLQLKEWIICIYAYKVYVKNTIKLKAKG